MNLKKWIGFLLAVAMIFAFAGCGDTAESGNSDKVFPTFEGKDLDGNKADSSLFKDNSVTVVNFWFSSCEACVAELGELNELNETLKEKGGAVIGVNTDTFGGNKKNIEEAKRILKKKNADYPNIWVSEDSDLAQYTKDFFGYPVTCVVDRNGDIMGKPIMGGINDQSVMKSLQEQIDKALKQQ